jgi:hypothetical protein
MLAQVQMKLQHKDEKPREPLHATESQTLSKGGTGAEEPNGFLSSNMRRVPEQLDAKTAILALHRLVIQCFSRKEMESPCIKNNVVSLSNRGGYRFGITQAHFEPLSARVRILVLTGDDTHNLFKLSFRQPSSLTSVLSNSFVDSARWSA